ncbi:hypothetical protein GCM10022630_35690 [Thermobifida alba]
MPLRSVKMKRFIFGFQRRVWCPKWTPLSSNWRIVTTVAMTSALLVRRAFARLRLFLTPRPGRRAAARA